MYARTSSCVKWRDLSPGPEECGYKREQNYSFISIEKQKCNITRDVQKYKYRTFFRQTQPPLPHTQSPREVKRWPATVNLNRLLPPPPFLFHYLKTRRKKTTRLVIQQVGLVTIPVRASSCHPL